jgi:5'-3' exonuclease
MGIPAFYKHLVQTVTGLTNKRRAPPGLLALDLNCAIYHCVRLQQRLTPYKASSASAFERALIERTIAYIQQLDRFAKPTHLYVAVDGVAPMAKLKQQRMRRFKSALGAEEEARVKAAAEGKRYVKEERWDTNAITPGTEFMERLTRALYAFQETNRSRIRVSPADEPGEGEQKIMAHLRGNLDLADVVIYGLDADLIILAMYHGAVRGARVDLLREETEFGGGVKTDAIGEEQYLYLDTKVLVDVLYATYGNGQARADFVAEFVGLMNLQGNDFVPHGMGLKIRDGGIERVLEIQRKSATPLVRVDPVTKYASYNKEALQHVLGVLAEEEAEHILKQSAKKLTQRGGMGKTEVERAMARYQDQPLVWRAEEALVRRMGGENQQNKQTQQQTQQQKPQYTLRDDWAARYDDEALGGAGAAIASVLYCESLGWTMAYYSGALVDTEWYYPWPLPPRFASINDALSRMTQIPVPATPRKLLSPKEQLAMVLPESSFHLLPAELRKICDRTPWAFPVRWPVHSLGCRFLWECEPRIPIVTPSQIRVWIDEIYEP